MQPNAALLSPPPLASVQSLCGDVHLSVCLSVCRMKRVGRPTQKHDFTKQFRAMMSFDDQ